MPKLPTFNAQVGNASLGAGIGGRRADASDLSDPGLIAAGRQIRATGESLLSHMEENEARQALVESTEIRARYAKALDEAALSGADLTKLREQMDAELAKIGEKFSTTKGASSLALYQANAGREYDQQANQIAVVRAATRARSLGQRLVNATAAEIDRDPSTLPLQIDKVWLFLEKSPGLSPETRTKLMDEWSADLNYKAATRSIALSPEASLKRLADGQWDVKPQQRETLIGLAKQEIEGQRRDRELKRLEAQRAEADAVDMARSKHIDAIIAGKANWAAIRDDSAFAGAQGANAKKELFLFMDARKRQLAGEERKGDLKLRNDLWLQINSGQVFNPQVIVDAVRAHAEGKPGLDLSQADYLLNQMRNRRDGGDQTFRASFASEIGRQRDILRADIMLNATEEGKRTQEAILSAIVYEAETAAEKRRTSTAKGQDPADLLNPTHKDYFFTKSNIEQIKARVVGKEQAAGVDEAIRNGAPRATSLSDPVLRDMKIGDLFVDGDGNVHKMTAALKKQVKAAAAEPPRGPTVTGVIR